MTSKRWTLAVALTSLAMAASGCGDDPVNNSPGDAGGDIGMTDTGRLDTGVDAGRDAGTDTGKSDDTGNQPDVPVDTGADTGADTGPDVVSTDADTDATTPDADMGDADTDAAMDADTDAGADAGEDAAVDTGPVDSGPMCPAPEGTLTLPSATVQSVAGTTVGGSNVITSSRCRAENSSPERVYTLTVTARTGVILSTDAAIAADAGTSDAGTSFDTHISLRRDCLDPATEVSCDDDSGGGTTSTLRAVLDPGTYTVIVEGYNTASGAFVLSARSFDPAANATCAGATTLTPGTPLTGQVFDGAGGPAYCGATPSGGGQLFYNLDLQADSITTVTLTRMTGTTGITLRAVDACDDTVCRAILASSSNPANLLISNSGMARRVIVSAALSSGDNTPVAFDLSASNAPLTAGQACILPLPLTPGTPRTGQSNAGAPYTSGPCRSDTGGQLFYTVQVPAGQRVRVTATPTSSPLRQPVLRAFDACTATTCVDNAIGGTSTTPAAGSVDIPNSGTTPRTVYVSLASTSATTAGTFDVSATLSPLVAGQFCAEPLVVAPGTTAMNQDARQGLRPSGACSSTTYNGGQLFYTVTLAAGQQTTVRAVPGGAMATWRPILRRVSTCTTTSCADSSTAAMDGGVAALSLQNLGTTETTYLLSVAGTAAASGTFNLEVAAATALPGYTSAPLATATCDDVTGGVTVPSSASSGAYTDDSRSAITALPFTVPFFGTMATHFSVTSNGFAQLWTSTSGTPSTAYSNTTIPSSGTPNNYVAPFWDDLRVVTGATPSRVLTRELGTGMDRRFVIQWTDFTYGGDDAEPRLTFQVKLYESGVIEYAYCTATPATEGRALGNSATIGVEDAMGLLGTQIANDDDNAAAPGTGYRLTPR